MFPIPFNFPFRKKDGSLTTIDDAISSGGGGGSYTLPTASASVKGGIKVGEGLTMDGETLKNTNPTPATPYTLPTASADTLGGIKVGNGLSIDDGVLSASGGGGSSITYRAGIVTEFNMSANNSWYKDVTFNTAMPNTDYVVTIGFERGGTNPNNINTPIPPFIIYNKTVNGFRVGGYNSLSEAINFCRFNWLAVAF